VVTATLYVMNVYSTNQNSLDFRPEFRLCCRNYKSRERGESARCWHTALILEISLYYGTNLEVCKMTTPRQFSLFVIAMHDVLMLRVGGLL